MTLFGAGLKDLVLNYPYVFEIVEKETIDSMNGGEVEESGEEFEVIPPNSEKVEVGIIDSGIMEAHKFLKHGIIPTNSKSYIDGDASTADEVINGGHGTKVTGAALYPLGLSESESPYQLPFYGRKLRVLDSNNSLKNKYPATLMRKIVDENVPDCPIFNMSINSTSPCRTKHMSSWAAYLIKPLIIIMFFLFYLPGILKYLKLIGTYIMVNIIQFILTIILIDCPIRLRVALV